MSLLAKDIFNISIQSIKHKLWGYQLLKISALILIFWMALIPLHANAPLTLPVTGERLALVIGNSTYTHAPLVNPGNDANAIAVLLRSAGFSVDLRLNASTADMQQAVRKLAKDQKNPKVKTVFFFYAGHAVQVDWHNYLVGTDANIKKIEDLPEYSLDISELISNFGEVNKEGGKQLVMILDACRDNPFRKELNLSQKGISQFDAPSNTLVAFSTAPGKVALDGEGINSYYTEVLLRELSIPYISLEDALKRVRIGVRVASLDRQIPWESTSLEQRFYLFPTEKDATLTADALESAIKRELENWNQAKSSNDITSLVAFLQNFPNGNFSQLAQFRLDEMLRQRTQQEAVLIAQRERGLEQVQRQQAEQEKLQAQAAAQAAAQEAERVRQEKARQAQEITDNQAKEQARLEQEKRQAQLAALARQQAEIERQAQQAAKAREQAEQAELERQRLALAQEQARLKQQEQLAKEQLAKEKLIQEQRAQREQAEREKQQALIQATTPKTPAPAPVPTAATEPLLVAAQQLKMPLLAPLPVLAQYPAITEQKLTAGPNFSGADPLGRVFRVGDQWAYKVLDRFTHRESMMELQVTHVDSVADRVTYNNGQFYSDIMGNATSTNMGTLDSPRQFYPATLQLGQRWVTSFMQRQTQGVQRFRYDVKIVAKENIMVPAGKFLTYRIEARGYNLDNGTSMVRTLWVTPGINANVALEVEVRTREGRLEQTYRWELARYSPTRAG